jgi:hypothetical protein
MPASINHQHRQRPIHVRRKNMGGNPYSLNACQLVNFICYFVFHYVVWICMRHLVHMRVGGEWGERTTWCIWYWEWLGWCGRGWVGIVWWLSRKWKMKENLELCRGWEYCIGEGIYGRLWHYMWWLVMIKPEWILAKNRGQVSLVHTRAITPLIEISPRSLQCHQTTL